MSRETKCRNCAGKGVIKIKGGPGWCGCTVCRGTGKVPALTKASRRA
jgi:hypothetical protein